MTDTNPEDVLVAEEPVSVPVKSRRGGRKLGSINPNAVYRNPELKRLQKKKANKEYYRVRGFLLDKIRKLKQEFNLAIETSVYEKKSPAELENIIQTILDTNVPQTVTKESLIDAINRIDNNEFSVKKRIALSRMLMRQN